MPRLLSQILGTALLYSMLLLLGVICLSWTLLALPLLLLPRRVGARCGRRGILVGFRFYVRALGVTGLYRLDLRALHALRSGPPVVLAPNHPSLIDAIFIIAHDPKVACVMKSALMSNVFLAAGARLARYIGNEPTRHMIVEAVAELGRGGSVLLFPEATRTVQAPVNPFTAAVAIIAKHANMPVQTLIIEQDSAFLGRGWSIFRAPRLPVGYRVRLGRLFEPQQDVRAFTAALECYFREELMASVQNDWLEGRRSRASRGHAESP